MLSTNQAAFDGADLQTAVLAVGPGSIEVRGVQLGFWPSPGALTTCIHLDTRHADAVIRIGPGSIVNNGCTFIAEGPGISIGRDALIGPGVEVYDSDFHAVTPSARRSAAPSMGHVSIGDNVFIGARSIVLQGASIGDGAVIGAGSVVVGHVPTNTVAAGNPARGGGSWIEASERLLLQRGRPTKRCRVCRPSHLQPGSLRRILPREDRRADVNRLGARGGR